MKPNPDFPDLLACRGVPSLDGQTVELRYSFGDDVPDVDFTVSLDDIVWVNMPPLPPPEAIDTPEKAKIIESVAPLFTNYGLALVACKVVERHPGFVVISVPAMAGPSRLSVKPENLARPHRPRRPGPR